MHQRTQCLLHLAKCAGCSYGCCGALHGAAEAGRVWLFSHRQSLFRGDQDLVGLAHAHHLTARVRWIPLSQHE